MLTSSQLLSLGISNERYQELTPDEKAAVEQILSEMSNDSKITASLEELYYADYEEIPVDFLTFLRDDNYLGKTTRNGNAIYPFWRSEGSYIFSTNDINEVAISGSIGTGKSTAADLFIAYHLYRTMCLRDPQAFFGLAQGTEITYAFLNNTLDSSYGVGYKTLQSFIKDSPWFLKHGKLVGRDQDEYKPDKGFGFIVGSKIQHTIGRAVICLTGDTEVLTTKGIYKIEDLVGKTIQVKTFSNEGEVKDSSECTVCKTGEVLEFMEIELEDGTIFKCTKDHLMLLSNGQYKRAGDLTEDDDLAYISN